jgi:hypothetical protein
MKTKTKIKMTQWSNPNVNIDIVCSSFSNGVAQAQKLAYQMGLRGKIDVTGQNGEFVTLSN